MNKSNKIFKQRNKSKSKKEINRFDDSACNQADEPSRYIAKNKISLTQNNRITYIYRILDTGRVVEVICVSLEIRYGEKWRTIIYYDNHHDFLHRHERINLETSSDITTTNGVRQKGTNRRLLRWAIQDISNNYISYKLKFLKRCNFEQSKIYEILT
jgi:hypothetical protein